VINEYVPLIAGVYIYL